MKRSLLLAVIGGVVGVALGFLMRRYGST